MESLEKTLREAKIDKIEKEKLGGRTGPWLVTLDAGAVKPRAVFRHVDRPRPHPLPTATNTISPPMNSLSFSASISSLPSSNEKSKAVRLPPDLPGKLHPGEGPEEEEAAAAEPSSVLQRRRRVRVSRT